MNNNRRRTDRKRKQTSYLVPRESDIFLPSYEWQGDWCSDIEEEEPVAATTTAAAAASATATTPTASASRQEQAASRRREATVSAVAVNQTAQERREEALKFIELNRNSNTQAAYTSAWRQFEKWVNEIENTQRRQEERVSVESPTEDVVALYIKYIVTVKQGTMTSVSSAMAGIADHLKYKITEHYHPCQGKLIDAMKAVLVPMAKESKQKLPVSWNMIAEIEALVVAYKMDERNTTKEKFLAKRDVVMIMLAYYGYLRASEIVRMRRRDVRFEEKEIEGETREWLVVFVDPLCKNDAERKGHERLIAGKQGKDATSMCMIQQMREWLKCHKQQDEQAWLFATVEGNQLSSDTPRGRLKEWLRRSGVTNPEEYGFHSLRAGAATESAKAGVSERLIKLHGNWKSDAVRVYIRPDESERLKASEALGQRKQ